MKRNQ